MKCGRMLSINEIILNELKKIQRNGTKRIMTNVKGVGEFKKLIDEKRGKRNQREL